MDFSSSPSKSSVEVPLTLIIGALQLKLSAVPARGLNTDECFTMYSLINDANIWQSFREMFHSSFWDSNFVFDCTSVLLMLQGLMPIKIRNALVLSTKVSLH